MIWYEQAFNKPDGTATLRGNFNPDAMPPACIVTITLELPTQTRTLYSHNPAIGHEEPNSDEVYAKYSHRLRKAIEYVQKRVSCADMEPEKVTERLP